MTMEEAGQSYGYILYTTHLDAGQSGSLVLDGLHDYARIYLDHALVGIVDRRLNQSSLDLPSSAKSRELEILVENSGRINYNVALRRESKGIVNRVLLADRELSGWSIYPLPLDHTDRLHYKKSPCSGPCFFRASLTVPSTPQDTFLRTDSIQKGFAWIDGIPLGRAWNAGPEASLFMPASWQKEGKNSLVVFDLQAAGAPVLQTADHALWVPGKDQPEKK
jgi:beta-galactosidase